MSAAKCLRRYPATLMAMAPQAHKFLATIYKIWMMRHVDVPPEIADALTKQLHTSKHSPTNAKHKPPKSPKPARPKYIPVIAIVNGRTARVTLTPAGGGRYRIQINTALRKAARADGGGVVSVELRLDLASRELPVPADLRAALKEHSKARQAFEELPAGHRRHFIAWFDSAKGTETRIRRLGRAIDFLLERALLRPPNSRRARPK
ncbi:MAG: YdeI/OmpD-associated family protein [Candidatus Acidiferrales bacterium]